MTITAESRLKHNYGKETSRESTSEINSGKMMAATKLLIDLVGEKDKFENMRVSDVHKEVFATFVNLCMVHFCSSMNWRYKAYNSHISEIFSVSDEAFAMLLLENNYEDYKMVYNLSRKVTRKESKPKYTKDSNLNEKFKGWSRKGLKRYDELVRIVTNQRRATISLELEEELKKQICQYMR